MLTNVNRTTIKQTNQPNCKNTAADSKKADASLTRAGLGLGHACVPLNTQDAALHRTKVQVNIQAVFLKIYSAASSPADRKKGAFASIPPLRNP